MKDLKEDMQIPVWIVIAIAAVLSVILLPRLLIIVLIAAVIYWAFKDEVSAFFEKHGKKNDEV
jgi:hypothetical protein